MNVLHVDSARSWRGGQNQVLLTALGQARLGHAVTLLCQEGGVLQARAREAGLAVAATHFRGDLWPGPARAVAGTARRVQAEVVHAHDPHAITAAVLARRFSPSRFTLAATRRVDFHLRGPLSRWKYRQCGRVIAVSRAIARVLEEDQIAPGLITVVYEGVPDRPPPAGGRALLESLGVPPGAPVVGNAAALTAHKDHATLLAAAALVRERRPDVHFVILGEGELREELLAQSARLELGEHCRFLGFRRDLDVLLPAFDVFCLSSQMEGLGTTLLDAMAFRRPIVATAAGGIPEAVQDGLTGRVVPPRDPPALAAALLEVLGDPARARYGDAGRVRFLERFTAERMVAATLAAYATRA